MACKRQLYLHGFVSWEKVVFVEIQLNCRVNSVYPSLLCFNISSAAACQVKHRNGLPRGDGDDTDLPFVWAVHTWHNRIMALSCLCLFDIHKRFPACSFTRENAPIASVCARVCQRGSHWTEFRKIWYWKADIYREIPDLVKILQKYRAFCWKTKYICIDRITKY